MSRTTIFSSNKDGQCGGSLITESEANVPPQSIFSLIKSLYYRPDCLETEHTGDSSMDL